MQYVLGRFILEMSKVSFLKGVKPSYLEDFAYVGYLIAIQC